MRLRILAACALMLMAPIGCKQQPADRYATLNGDATIQSANGKVNEFKIEIASTPEAQARGLMSRESLAPNAGMLFPINPARKISVWMKDTPISLDILFIRKDGTIAKVASDAVPYSQQLIDSEVPVAAILEISGGRAAQLGIKEGGRVSW